MLSGKSTPQKELVSDFSLIKCEARFDKNVLRIARELIWVAYNSEKDTSLSYEYLHNMFNEVYDAIVEAYSMCLAMLLFLFLTFAILQGEK